MNLEATFEPLRKSPLHSQVKKALRVFIGSTTADSLPTESELQQKFNVSRITVRRALKELEDEGLIQSIQGSGRVITRSLSPERTGYIGIVQGRELQAYQQEILFAVDSYLKKHRIMTALNVVDPRDPDIEERLSLFAQKVDGLIFCNFIVNNRNLYSVLKEHLHKCVILRDPPHTDYPMHSIQEDRVLAFEKIATHLKLLGHTDIAFIGASKSSLRMEGIRRGLGRELAPDLVIDAPGWRHTAYAATGELLARKKHFSAIICNSDTCALGVMERLIEAGIRIPEDVSITGYDNIADSAHYPVPLTTAGASRMMLAEKAVDLIFRNTADSFPSKILIEPELIIRESTDIPPRRK